MNHRNPSHTILLLLVLVWAEGLNAQTLTLDSCLSLARQNNSDIRTSQLEVEQASLVKRQVFTKYFPQVQLNAFAYNAVDPLIHFGISDIQSSDMRDILNGLYNLVNETGSDIQNELSLMKSGASASLIAAQPIFAGGRIVNGNRLARLGVEAAGLQSEMKIRDILENIESTYYLVTGLQQKEATIEAALALIDSLDHTAQIALENGLVTRADALQLHLKRNEMLANKQQLTSGIRLSRRLLCQQIGIEYSDSIVFADPYNAPIPTPPLTLVRPDDTKRPELRLLEVGVEAERLQKRLTLGETLPQLTVVVGGYYGNALKNDASANAVALLTLSIPLTNWWETSYKLRQHDIRIEEASIRQDNLTKMMSIEEEKAYSDMVDAYMLLRSDSAALDIAIENYRLAELNYKAGMVTLSEVLQAHALLLQAQNAITDRRTTYIMAWRRLYDLTNTDI